MALKGPLVAFQIDQDSSSVLPIVILDIGTETLRTVQSELIGSLLEIKWQGNGCRLETGLVGELIDLQGNPVYEVAEDYDLYDWNALSPHDEHRSYYARVSPDGQWLAYDIAYGQELALGLDIAHEYNDIGIINRESPEDPILVTNSGQTTQFVWSFYEANGRAPSKFTWSTDSRWLIYTDVDAAGIRQIYRFSPLDGRKEQLTFYEIQHAIFYPSLSPDNGHLAVATYENEPEFDETSGRLDIIALPDLSRKSIALNGSETGNPDMARPMWIRWNTDSKTVALSGIDSSGDNAVLWVQAASGEAVDVITEHEWPLEIKDRVFPIGSIDRLLLWTDDNQFYVFDRVTRELSPLSVRLPEGPWWWYLAAEEAPFDFPGEENCSK